MLGQFFGRLLGFIFLLILASTFWTIPLHEYFHWTLIREFGGSPVMRFDTVLVVWPVAGSVGFAPGEYIPTDSSWFWATYVGGGALTALVLGIPLWLFARWTPEKGDIWIGTLGLAIMLVQGLYAPVELALFFGNLSFAELYETMGEVPVPDFLEGAFGGVKVYSVASLLSTLIAMLLVFILRVRGMWQWLIRGQPFVKREVKIPTRLKNRGK